MEIVNNIHPATQIVSCEMYLFRNNIYDNRLLGKIKNIIDINKDSIDRKRLIESLSLETLTKGKIYAVNNFNCNSFILDILNLNKHLNNIRIIENKSFNTSRLVENTLIWEYTVKEVRIDLNLCKSKKICEAIIESNLFKRQNLQKSRFDFILDIDDILNKIEKLSYDFSEEQTELFEIFNKLKTHKPKIILVFPEKMFK